MNYNNPCFEYITKLAKRYEKFPQSQNGKREGNHKTIVDLHNLESNLKKYLDEFKFIETCFMVHFVVYLGKYPMCT